MPLFPSELAAMAEASEFVDALLQAASLKVGVLDRSRMVVEAETRLAEARRRWAEALYRRLEEAPK